MTPQEALDWMAGLPQGPGYLLLAAAAALEYVFPPFPGDTVTLLGGVLSQRAGWPLPLTLAAVTAGSVAGAMLNYELGAWLGRATPTTWLHRRLQSPSMKPKVDALCARFSKHGAIYIALNRFLPGVRGIFFLVAGLARLPRAAVALWAAASALAWNLMIVLAGLWIGFELDRLIGFVQRYTRVAWIALAAAAVAWGLRALWRRRRSPPE
jgi:membrane protein DedA with SNARE-associated domain